MRILHHDIPGLLEHKLGAGKPAEMRTGLIYLNIFRICKLDVPSSCRCCQTSPDGEDGLTQKLAKRGMSHLKTNQWDTQKAGVAILCSLVQTCLCNVILLYCELH